MGPVGPPAGGGGSDRSETEEGAAGGSWATVEAVVRLLELPGVGDATLEALLARFGDAPAALDAPAAAFVEVAGPEAEAARGRAGIRDRARDVVRTCRHQGIGVVVRGGPGYPAPLLHLARPPALLFLRGDPGLLHHPAVTVVGSRRSTSYGRRVAREVARALVGRGLGVASGLALGIDAAAHRAAVEEGGATVAVLGCGVDVVHPPSNRGLARRMARDGLLVSELLPGTPPLPHHFPRRNRILAALGRAVVVVEAARRSGALITADLALELGRDVAAVPGSIYAPASEGANRLVRVGAHPLLAPEDVLELPGVEAALREIGDAGTTRPGPDERESADRSAGRLVLELLARGEPLGVDEIARGSGLSAGVAAATLATLELQGRVERDAGMRFLRRAPR